MFQGIADTDVPWGRLNDTAMRRGFQACTWLVLVFVTALLFQEGMLTLVLIPAVCVTFGLRLSVVVSAVVVGTAMGRIWFIWRMCSPLDPLWAFPAYNFAPLTRESAFSLLLSLGASSVAALVRVGCRKRSGRRPVRVQTGSACAIVSASFGFVVVATYCLTHTPYEVAVADRYSQLEGLSPAELSAYACDGNATTDERLSAVIILGLPVSEDGSAVDECLGLLRSVAEHSQDNARIVGAARQMADSLKLVGTIAPSEDPFCTKEDMRRAAFRTFWNQLHVDK